jgi:hypothetical protein
MPSKGPVSDTARVPFAEADANHGGNRPGCPLAFDSGEAHRLADKRVLMPWAITRAVCTP